MNCLNSLIIEGRVTEKCSTGRFKLATWRTYRDGSGNEVEHTCVFDVAGGCAHDFEIGTRLRVVGKIECDPTFKSVWIVPEHIEIQRS